MDFMRISGYAALFKHIVKVYVYNISNGMEAEGVQTPPHLFL